MTNNNPIIEPYSTLAHRTNEFLSLRAATYLNFAYSLHIDPRDAANFASDSLDDPIHYAERSTARDDRSIMTALACNLYHSDDDFDDFLHELDHTLNICAELIAADQHPLCCPCSDCDI